MDEFPRQTLSLRHHDSERTEPSDDLTLWRYLDFPKFLDLIATSSLKMPRASAMEDVYEGIIGDAAASTGIALAKQRGEPSYLRNASLNLEIAQSLFWRERTYISCWNAFPTENAGLWRIYGDNKGVAIKTTWGRLKSSLPKFSDCISTIFFGNVDYRRFEIDTQYPRTYTDQYFIKRHEFSHESEFRLVAHDSSREHNYNEVSTSGLPLLATLACDLDVLIDELVVSPRLEDWAASAIASTCRQFDGDWKVRRSNLYDPIVFPSSKF